MEISTARVIAKFMVDKGKMELPDFIAGAGSLFMKPTLVGESPLDEYV